MRTDTRSLGYRPRKTSVNKIGNTPLSGLSEVVVRGWLERYFGAYDARDADPNAWERTLDEVTGELWEAGIGLIVETLRSAFGADRAVLVPTGPLGLLPLHAGWTGPGAIRRYALDEVGFRTAAGCAEDSGMAEAGACLGHPASPAPENAVVSEAVRQTGPGGSGGWVSEAEPGFSLAIRLSTAAGTGVRRP